MNSKTTSPANRKFVPALLALLFLILTVAACGGAGTHSNPGTTPGTTYPFLSEVTLQPGSAPSIAVAGTVQVGANAGYQVSATEIQYNDVTTSATWSSSNAAVATVDKGLVTGAGIGSATISASLDGKTGTTLVVVGQTPTLDITPSVTPVFSLSANPDRHFQASASYSDGSVLDLTGYVTWSSSAPGVLKFYNDYVHDPGEAALLATGTATITATLDTGDVGSLDVTVLP
jgi:trimeric autotransporter adhesin